MQQNFAPNTLPASRPAELSSAPGRAAVTFLLCAVYFTLTLAIVGLVTRLLELFRPAAGTQLAVPLLNLLILLAGYLLIARMRVPELRPLSAIGLVRRPSTGREVGLGAAAGWAIGVALLLPAVVSLRMHSTLLLDGFHLGAMTASTLELLLFVLGRQLLLCGLPFRSLSQATSPLFASVAFAGVAALLTIYNARGDWTEALLAGMAQLIFGMAAARTRAIWLGSALQFVWGLTITLLFGLPSFLWPSATGVVQSSISGPRWLAGNVFGPEAAVWAGLVAVAALMVVWRVTREYAWHYTFEPIVSAGYAMDVPPPAEHARMEQTAAQAAPLVQIGGVTSTLADTAPARTDAAGEL